MTVRVRGKGHGEGRTPTLDAWTRRDPVGAASRPAVGATVGLVDSAVNTPVCFPMIREPSRRPYSTVQRGPRRCPRVRRRRGRQSSGCCLWPPVSCWLGRACRSPPSASSLNRARWWSRTARCRASPAWSSTTPVAAAGVSSTAWATPASPTSPPRGLAALPWPGRPLARRLAGPGNAAPQRSSAGDAGQRGGPGLARPRRRYLREAGAASASEIAEATGTSRVRPGATWNTSRARRPSSGGSGTAGAAGPR